MRAKTPRADHLLAVVVMAAALAGCGRSQVAVPPALTSTAPEASQIAPEIDVYRILVHDELTVTILGYPELSGPLRVLPDGTLTVPGVGPVYVLGMSVVEVTEKIKETLSGVVRYPQLSVAVSDFGERRIFVMGEIVLPGDHEYHRGMTVLGAIAEAGGFNNNAKRSSVMVLRRTGPEEATAFRVDLRGVLKGEDLEQNLPVRPHDIIYVPKTFIASVNVLMDQYFRQLMPPFSLYTEGWEAFHLDEDRVRLVTP
jgi:protein involved in polysaccharide export with SLBB domain